MKWKRLLLSFLVAALLPGGCAGGNIQEKEGTGAGGQSGTVQQEPSIALPEGLSGAADFEAYDMEGNAVSREIFAESKLTMVNVWATYCNPCLREMPALGELAQAYDAGDFRIIGIISDVPENAEEEVLDIAKELIAQTGADYTHLLLNESLYDALLTDVSAVPTTFFFDANGMLLDTVVGAMEKASWEEKIDGLLAEK
ncbi:MAG: TlpA family protein disulfide reductase [Blautia sp.]|nr:TlpA family protein disulfide reductase [Blautia sp.]MCM1201965.1 TlpA family protein disulfide reductase [Bacteroides fragilis]